MLRTTPRSLLARKLRLVLSALAIVLGVGFVTGTLVLTDTLNRTFNGLFADIDKNTSVKVRAKSNLADSGSDQSSGTSGGSGAPVPGAVLDRVRGVPGVAEAVGTVQGFAVLTTRVPPAAQGKPPAQAEILSNENAPPIGVAFNGSPVLSPLKVDSGSAPTGAADIAVDRGTFEKKKLRLGQDLAVATQKGVTGVRVVGTFRFGTSNNLAGATLVAFAPPTAQRLLLKPGEFTDVTIAAAPGVSQTELRDRIATVLPGDLEALTGQQIIKENADNLAKGLGGFSTFLQAFGYISLFVGAFIISNTFSMLIGQRVRELALLRAIGASKRQVRRSVIVEALAVGLVGSTLGLAFGFGVAVLLKGLLGAFGIDLPAGGVVFQPRTAIVAYLIGTITTVLAALGPARRAAKVPPVAAMRDVELTPTGSLRRRTLLGSTTLAVGAALTLVGLNTSGSKALLIVGLGAGAVFLGVATLSPLISRPVLKVIGAPFAAFGTVGRMSRENARRSPRRTSATAAALMIGLALVSAFSVFGTSIKTSIRDLFGDSLKADFIVTGGSFNQQPFSPVLADQLRKLPDVAAVSQLRFASVDIDGAKKSIQAENPEGLTEVLNLQRNDGKLDLTGMNLLVSRKVLNDQKWKIGQSVTIRWAETGDTRFTVAGTYEQNQLAGDYLVPLSAYDANVTQKLDSIVLVKATGAAAVESVRNEVTKALVPYPNLDVRDQKEFVADNAKQIDSILNLITALLTFAIIIATFGIINTLLLSVVERTREIGLLRAVGLQRRQTRRMIRLEAIMIAVYGGVLGLAVGSFFGWALVSAFTRDSDFGSFHYPFGQLIGFLVVSAVLGVLAAIIPAWRASKTNVLQAIATT